MTNILTGSVKLYDISASKLFSLQYIKTSLDIQRIE